MTKESRRRLTVAAICMALLVAVPAMAEGILTSLAEEVQVKGRPASGFEKFAAALDVPDDIGTLRAVRAKHPGRLRMVWSRPMPGAEGWQVFFADFRPESGLLFLTDDSGTLWRGVRLQKDAPPVAMDRAEAQPEFERERAFWLRWAR
jgi:hypothetical protein